MKLFFYFCFFLLFSATICKAQSQLSITIFGVKNSMGVVRIALFNKEDGFPLNDKKAYKLVSAKIEGTAASAVLQNIPLGKYAIVSYHDENNNNNFDVNFLGVPKEGTGTSNATEKAISKPNYYNALFVLNENSKSIFLHLFY